MPIQLVKQEALVRYSCVYDETVKFDRVLYIRISRDVQRLNSY
ncbi:hypothetical protein PL9214290283 [Planktothrix tepida PCC 9214]|uniref:Uncharacterized protein n=1 Tax=Planktothrix tepida PCC 9214 TaxID=671072 RepID=A0A1J1LDK9_9CYAN|nr:hypothetical protein PL9214290283 [Planktothrix tepida PCC 9214]